MQFNPDLVAAIASTDLSTWQARLGATALAVALLEKIYSAEDNELDWLSICLIRFGESAEKEFISYENNLKHLLDAVSILYNTFELQRFRRLGIYNYIRNDPESGYSANPMIP